MVNGSDQTFGYVVDIGEISRESAVVEYFDCLPSRDGITEKHRRHVGASPRAVDRKKAEPGRR